MVVDAWELWKLNIYHFENDFIGKLIPLDPSYDSVRFAIISKRLHRLRALSNEYFRLPETSGLDNEPNQKKMVDVSQIDGTVTFSLPYPLFKNGQSLEINEINFVANDFRLKILYGDMHIVAEFNQEKSHIGYKVSFSIQVFQSGRKLKHVVKVARVFEKIRFSPNEHDFHIQITNGIFKLHFFTDPLT